jgi:riboflavin transporter FmnP
MSTSLKIPLHLFYLFLGTLAGFTVTLFLSNLFFPEHGCISLKGIFWALIYIAFFITTTVQIIKGKKITVSGIIKNLFFCAVLPNALLVLLSVFG